MDRSAVAPALAVVGLLVVAGCSSGTAPTNAPDGGTSAGSHGATTTSPAASGTTAPRVVTSTDPSSGASTDAHRASGGAVPTSGSPAAGHPPSTSAGAFAFPPAGDYTYRVHGSAKSAFGDQKIDGPSALTVDPPAGQRQHTTQKDQAGTTEQTLVSRRAGLFLADVKMAQNGFNEEFRPSTPVLLLPVGARPGRRWHWTMASTDGKYTLDADLMVGRPRDVSTADGTRVHTVTISSVLVISGSAVSLTIHQLDRASYDGLVLTEHAVTDGTAFGTKFHSDITRTLMSHPR